MSRSAPPLPASGRSGRWSGSALPGLAALAAAYVLSYFFRSMLAVIAPEMAVDLAVDPGQLGRISAAYFFAFALAQIPIGIALDRFGPRRTLTALMGAAVLGAGLFATATSYAEAVAAQALIGIGCAPVLMGSMVVIDRWFPADRFATLSALIVAIGNAGNLLGATPMAAAAAALGWRGAMLAVMAITLLVTVLVFLLVRDRPPGAPLPRGGSESVAESLRGVLAVLRLRLLWPTLPLFFMGYAAVIAVRGLWAGPYLTAVYGLDPIERGNVLLAMAAAMTLGALAYGPLDRVFGTRRGVVTAGTAILLLGLAGLALRPDAGVTAATLLLIAIGGCGMTYTVMMAHGRAFVPDHLVGRGVTLLNFFTLGGVAVVQTATGTIVDTAIGAGLGPEAVYQVLFACLAGALALALAIYRLSRDAPPPRRP